MNKHQQILRNLHREVARKIRIGANGQEIQQLFVLAECAMGNNPKCGKCHNVFTCGELTCWNDITDKELMRKL